MAKYELHWVAHSDRLDDEGYREEIASGTIETDCPIVRQYDQNRDFVEIVFRGEGCHEVTMTARPEAAGRLMLSPDQITDRDWRLRPDSWGEIRLKATAPDGTRYLMKDRSSMWMHCSDGFTMFADDGFYGDESTPCCMLSIDEAEYAAWRQRIIATVRKASDNDNLVQELAECPDATPEGGDA
jgi:hypothetical protein